jgi:ankyrin repeat protein
MMIYHRIIIIITTLIALLMPLGAFGKTELSPEEARKALERLSIEYNEMRFYDAIYNNDTVIAKLFLLSGMSPNTVFSLRDKGATPLIIASYKNNKEMSKLLIEKGANVNYRLFLKQNEELTALYYAIANLNYEICKILLQNGAHTYIINRNNYVKLNKILDKMLERKEYISSIDGKPVHMDEQAKEKAIQILELLKKYPDNDLITLTGRGVKSSNGWTFEIVDETTKTKLYKLRENLPDMIEKILEQAKNQNANFTIVGEFSGDGFIDIAKINFEGKLYSVRNNHSEK